MEHEGDGDTNYNWHTWNGPQRLEIGAGCVGSLKRNRDNPNNSIAEFGQNIQKSPEDLRRLAVTQIPVKGHQLTLVGNMQ